jgi:hypothetical protein
MIAGRMVGAEVAAGHAAVGDLVRGGWVRATATQQKTGHCVKFQLPEAACSGNGAWLERRSGSLEPRFHEQN